MAAGTVTILGDIIPDVGGSPSRYRILWGTVQLDGSNPTDVDLAGYVESITLGIASLVSVAPPAGDPVTVGVSTATTVLSIEAYKPTNADCTTMVDSTDNADSVAWFAIGPTLL